MSQSEDQYAVPMQFAPKLMRGSGKRSRRLRGSELTFRTTLGLGLLRRSGSSLSGTRSSLLAGCWDGLREETLGGPDVDDRLHGLQITISEQVVRLANVDKVDEVGVDVLLHAQMPEWLDPMAVVDVGIATHHLTVDAADVRFEVFWETRCSANPIAMARKILDGCIDGGRSRRNGLITTRGRRTRRIVGRREGGVDREQLRVTNFAVDPLLDELDVLDSGNADRLLVAVEPSVGVSVKISILLFPGGRQENSYPAADMAGQTSGLQIGIPVRSSLVVIMERRPCNIRYCSTTVLGQPYVHPTSLA
jgi:hypothetical protein